MRFASFSYLCRLSWVATLAIRTEDDAKNGTRSITLDLKQLVAQNTLEDFKCRMPTTDAIYGLPIEVLFDNCDEGCLATLRDDLAQRLRAIANVLDEARKQGPPAQPPEEACEVIYFEPVLEYDGPAMGGDVEGIAEGAWYPTQQGLTAAVQKRPGADDGSHVFDIHWYKTESFRQHWCISGNEFNPMNRAGPGDGLVVFKLGSTDDPQLEQPLCHGIDNVATAAAAARQPQVAKVVRDILRRRKYRAKQGRSRGGHYVLHMATDAQKTPVHFAMQVVKPPVIEPLRHPRVNVMLSSTAYSGKGYVKYQTHVVANQSTRIHRLLLDQRNASVLFGS